MVDWAIEFMEVSRGELRNFSLNINPGERVMVLGSAGGLSLELGQMVMNLKNLDGGKIRVFGRNHRTNEARTKLLLGYVGKEISFYPDLRSEQIARLYAPHYPGWNKEKWKELQTRLKINTEKPIREWKDEEKERLQLALALARNAEVMIFAGTAELAWQYRSYFSHDQTILLEGNGIEKWLKEAQRIIIFGEQGKWISGSRKELGERLRKIEISGQIPENIGQEFFLEHHGDQSSMAGITCNFKRVAEFMGKNHPEINWNAKNVDLIELSRRFTGGKKDV